MLEVALCPFRQAVLLTKYSQVMIHFLTLTEWRRAGSREEHALSSTVAPLVLNVRRAHHEFIQNIEGLQRARGSDRVHLKARAFRSNPDKSAALAKRLRPASKMGSAASRRHCTCRC